MLAYQSGGKNTKIQHHLRGSQTRQRLQDGNDVIQQQMKEYNQGDLMNVHNMRLDQSSEESAIYSGQMLKDH